jgi:Zn-dependent peptidase ImmA (M78 family)
MEWQANEGAAQFLMPYQSFIPNYAYYHDHFHTRQEPNRAAGSLIAHLARQYKAGHKAVEYRIIGLKKEIAQYLGGAEIKNIKIQSRKRQP